MLIVEMIIDIPKVQDMGVSHKSCVVSDLVDIGLLE